MNIKILMGMSSYFLSTLPVFDMLQTVVFHSYRILYSNYFVFGIISIYKIETITWCSMHKMDK